MSGFYEGLGRIAVRHRLAILVIYLAISLLLIWQGSTIRLETSLAELLPPGTPSADDFKDLLEAEGSLDNLLIVLWRHPGDPDPDDEALALEEAAGELARFLMETGLVRDVRYGVEEEDLSALTERALAHFPVLVAPDQAGEVAKRLEVSSIREAVASIRRRAMLPGFAGPFEVSAARDPLGLLPFTRREWQRSIGGIRVDPESGLLLSEDGRRLLMVAEPVHPPTEVAFSRRLMESVREAESSLRGAVSGGDRLRFDHAGGYIFALEDERRIRHDAATTSLFALAAIAAIYLFVIRRPILWLVVLVPLTMSTLWTLGLAAIYPGRLNMVTVAFAAILLGIGDDAMIHIYLREREEHRRGLPAPASAVAALAATGPAVTVATVTSAAAFLSLAFVRFRGLSELGVIAAIGMLNLLIGILFFFPAALAILAGRRGAGRGPSLRLPMQAILRTNEWAERRRRAVLLLAALLSAGMAVAASGVRISSDLRAIRGEDPAADAMERVLAAFAPGEPIERMVIIHGGREPVPEPDGGERVQRGLESAFLLEAYCREGIASGRLAGCDVPTLMFPPDSIQRARFQSVAGLPWSEAASAFEREAEAAGMDLSFFSPFLDAVRRYDDFDAVRIRSDADLFGVLGVPRTTIFLRGPSRASAVAREVRRRLEPFPVRIASVALLSADLERILGEDFRRAALLVAIAITVLAVAAFRGVRLFLLTITPVLVGLVWLLGTARLAGVELNLMSLMGMPVVFGLGIDFGVYVVDRWARGGRDLRAALAGVGPAVLVTGLTTLAGFAALLSAELAGLRSLGFVVVVGAGYTLAAALLILPLLLSFGERRSTAVGPR